MQSPLKYGFPTVFGRGLYSEFKNFVHPPFLVVTMEDLWPLFGHHFEGADHRVYFTGSIEESDLERDAAGLTDIQAVVGLGGGQALDVAKYFAWRRRLPLFQAPTALSVNAVYGQRAGLRVDGAVVYRLKAVRQYLGEGVSTLATASLPLAVMRLSKMIWRRSANRGPLDRVSGPSTRLAGCLD